MHRLAPDLYAAYAAPTDVTVDQKARMMLGTSPGIYEKHDPAGLPLDAVTYMLRADEARKLLDADGVFLALDKRHEPSPGKVDEKAIRQRTDRLRELVQRLTGLRFITESEFDPEALERTYDDYDPELFGGAKSKSYWRRQTVVVLHSLGAPESKPAGVPLYKFGAVKTRDAAGMPMGGEVDFDGYLPAGLVTPVYAPPGYDVKGEVEVPYLLNRAGKDKRIILPFRNNQIDRELAKLDGGVARITYGTWLETAKVLLQEEDRKALNAESLTKMPLGSEDRELVTDAASLQVLRAKLRAALSTFCS
jgi:hypothetical protein